MSLLVLMSAALAAEPWELWDAAPHTDRDPVLVVRTPGVELPAYLPLVQALVATGRDVQVLGFPCRGQGAAELADGLVEAAATLPGGYDVVAHGLGATLVLQADDRLDAARHVLLAPVLGVPPIGAVRHLATLPIGLSVDLSAPGAWRDRDLAALLVGEPAHLGCVPVPFAREVQSWIAAGDVPVSLEAVDTPVFVAVSLGDDVASVETAVPASRRLPDRELTRLGLNRLDPRDFSHGEMLSHPVPVRVAVREVSR